MSFLWLQDELAMSVVPRTIVSSEKKPWKLFTGHILRSYSIKECERSDTMKSIQEHELTESAHDDEKVSRISTL